MRQHASKKVSYQGGTERVEGFLEGVLLWNLQEEEEEEF